MKKCVCFIALLLSFVIFVSGCGNNARDGKQTNSGNEMVISIVPQNDQAVDPQSPLIKECERILGVKFDFIYLDRNRAGELLNIRISSGQIPDIMTLSDERFRAYVQQGVLAAIPEEKVQTVAPELYRLTKEFIGENAWNYPREDGKLYGLPGGNINGSYHYVPIWRDDWLKNVGIHKIPETLEEAEIAFYKFVNEDPNKSGAKDTYALSDKGFSTVYGAFGGIPHESVGGSNGFTWTIKEDGTAVATATLPGMKDALTLLNKWYKDGLIDPEFISGENKGTYWGNSVSFWNGRIGFSVPGLAYHVAAPFNDKDPGSTHYTSFKELQGKDATYIEGRPLIGPNGDSGTERWGVFKGGAVSFGKYVSDDEAKMDKILEMFEKINTDYDFNIMTRYGFEGEHHEMDPVTGVTFIGKATEGEFRAKLGMMTNGIYRLNNNKEFERIPKTATFENLDKHKYTDNYANPIWGGLPSYPQYKTTINKMIMENYTLFITGARKISEFDAFVDELNYSGLQQLTKEANEWYKMNQ